MHATTTTYMLKLELSRAHSYSVHSSAIVVQYSQYYTSIPLRAVYAAVCTS